MREIERSNISVKARNISFYLEKIGIDRFGKLEVFSTGGDRVSFPYQWLATSIPYGDCPFEGIGKTPLEAMRNLYHSMKEEGL